MHNNILTVIFDDNTQKNIVFATAEQLEEVLLIFKEICGLQRLSEDELNEFLGEKAEKIKPYLHVIDGEYEMITSYTATCNYGNSIVSYSYKKCC